MGTTTDWVQDSLLLVNALLFAWYLYETKKMRRSAEIQVTLSQNQVEAQSKPFLIARLPDNGQRVELVNIGSGPALHLEFKSVLRGATDEKIVTGIGNYDRVVFLEPAQAVLTHVRTREPDIPATYWLDSSGRSLRCEYRSLSGRVYFSVFDFDHTGNFVENTHFGEREALQN